MNPEIKLHKDDLPDNLVLGPIVACDSEFTGLTPGKDKLCLIQLCAANSKEVHIIQLDRQTYQNPNLNKLLIDKNVKKIFHFARKDLEMIKFYLKIDVENIECSKLQSRIARGYSDQHSYKALVKEFIGIDISNNFDDPQRAIFGTTGTSGATFFVPNKILPSKSGVLWQGVDNSLHSH